jgi:hypothetical protein
MRLFENFSENKTFICIFCRSLLVLFGFCTFSYGHCVVCSSIYRFWLPFWHLQTLLPYGLLSPNFCCVKAGITKITGGELRCSRRVSSSCSTSDTGHVNLVTNPVTSHERGKHREVFTTSGTYPIYRFWLPFWHLQTLLPYGLLSPNFCCVKAGITKIFLHVHQHISYANITIVFTVFAHVHAQEQTTQWP